jgi:ATP-dependent helicase HrpB
VRSDADLPVTAVLPALVDALRAGRDAVLVAPPGTGKTTVAPLAVLDAVDGAVLLLEPRRLAARAAAERLAAALGEPVGRTVGLRMRGDTRVSAATRLAVVTEGVLPLLLHDDPTMDGIAAVLFDEFHERSLDADLGLALCLDVQATLRPDLRLVAMSATIDGAAVAGLLGDAAVVASDAPLHPITDVWSPAPLGEPVERHVAAAVRRSLAEAPGDVLAFLPGAGEIARTAALLADLAPHVAVLALHGSLPPAAQDAALRPDPAGRRRVVLATSVAETSLTVPGVRGVVDGGLARIPVFDAARGLPGLATVRVSRAAAEQRRGRAGRLGPGRCERLWSATEHARLLPAAPPEIATADLAPLVLALARWGITDPASLRWCDPPPADRITAARAELVDLGLLDADGRLTAEGEGVATLALHPRLGHLVRRGIAAGQGALACAIAAVLGGAPDRRGTDLADVLADPPGRVREDARRLRARVGVGIGVSRTDTSDAGATGRLVATAFPERIARRRPDGRYLLASGTGAALPPNDALGAHEWLAVAEIDTGTGTTADARIRLAAPLTLDEARAAAPGLVRVDRRAGWDRRAGDVVAVEEERIGAIVVRTRPVDPPPGAVLDGVRIEGLTILGWSPAATAWRGRVALLHATLGDPWPAVDDAALLAALDDWLAPFLPARARRADLARVDLVAALATLLPWPLARDLDRLAPTHVELPTGRRVALDYRDDGPVLAVKLQEVFGWTATPTVVDGRVPATLELLSPAGRPAAITRDLAGFWAGAYAEVRKDLRGRYPRHHWPDDPTTATATRGPRPR